MKWRISAAGNLFSCTIRRTFLRVSLPITSTLSEFIFMLDSRLLRTSPETVAQGLAKRGVNLDIAKIQALEETRKAIQIKTENLQQERNTRSKSIGKAKQAGEDIAPLMQAVEQIKQQLAEAEAELTRVQAEWDEFVSGLPNVPADEVPEG